MRSSELTPLEYDALKLMLVWAPIDRGFLSQLDAAKVIRREETGVGVFVYLQVPDSLAVAAKDRIVISNLSGEAKKLKHGFGGLLFIESGKLHDLEFFTYDEPWPANLLNYRLGLLPAANQSE
jgi:hypothetical protein